LEEGLKGKFRTYWANINGFRREKGTFDAIWVLRITLQGTLGTDEELCGFLLEWQKTNLDGRILRKNCLLKRVIEGNVHGREK
jgi:hypothetical protein